MISLCLMHSIDKVLVFRTLNHDQLSQILDIELGDVQRRILATQQERLFALECTASAKDFILKEGTDPRYGARHLKRAIEQHLVAPLSGLISTGQIEWGDKVSVDLAPSADKLIFVKEEPVSQRLPEPGLVTPVAFDPPNRDLTDAKSWISRTAMR